MRNLHILLKCNVRVMDMNMFYGIIKSGNTSFLFPVPVIGTVFLYIITDLVYNNNMLHHHESKSQLLESIQSHTKDMTSIETLYYLLDKFDDEIALSSSLGVEDQALTHMIVSHRKNTRIFTLDTGRLPEETYCLIDNTNLHFDIKLEVFFPQASAVEQLVGKKGLFSFYESIENRKECCTIRKSEPLSRALKGLKIWITGLRREQSITRTGFQLLEWDNAHNLIKINPLIDWTEQQVWDHVYRHDVPYNELHIKGYPSIGCAPCSRAVKKGQDIRSGRWWWENPVHKECGLHIK